MGKVTLTSDACWTNTSMQGAIHAMVIAGQALVSAGQDNSIRVWNFNQQAGIFMSQVQLPVVGRCSHVIVSTFGLAENADHSSHQRPSAFGDQDIHSP
jgi:hypothetical protein